VAALVFRLARDNDLGGDVDIGPGGIASDLDAIGEGRGGGVSPAGTAVLGNVLVADVGEVVGAVDVVPDDLLRDVVLGLKRSVDAGSGTVEVADAARGLVGDSAVSDGGDAEEASDSEFHLE
jgi:hypothetical protein